MLKKRKAQAPNSLCLVIAGLMGGGCTTIERHDFPTASVAITNVSVIDVQRGVAVRNQTVMLQGADIISVKPSKNGKQNAERIIDGRGKYLIPGLWDAHVHLGFAGDCSLPLLVANGVTSVRDLGTDMRVIASFRMAANTGRLVAPSIKAAGAVVENTPFVEQVTRAAARPEFLKYRLLDLSPRVGVAGPADAQRAVDAIAASGADMIKFRNIGGDSFLALAKAAEAKGLPLVGHSPLKTDPALAAESGLDSFEHGESISLLTAKLSTAERTALFRRMAAAGAMITPTLVSDYIRMQGAEPLKTISVPGAFPDIPKELLSFWEFGVKTSDLKNLEQWPPFFRRSAEDLRMAHAAGVRMLVGTDLAVPLIIPGTSVHDEMILMGDRLGLSNAEVLRAAILNPGHFFNERGAGLIAAGARADMVLLDSDPLKDLAAVRSISGVTLRGRHFDRAELDTLIAGTRDSIRRNASCSLPAGG